MKELLKNMWVSGEMREKLFDMLDTAAIEPHNSFKRLYVGTFIPTEDRSHEMSNESDTHIRVSSGGLVNKTEIEKFLSTKFLRSKPEKMKIALIESKYNHGRIPSYRYEIEMFENINDYVKHVIDIGNSHSRKGILRSSDIMNLTNYAIVTSDLELFLKISVTTKGYNFASRNSIPLHFITNNEHIPFDLEIMDEFFSNKDNLTRMVSRGFNLADRGSHISFFLLIALRYNSSLMKNYFNSHFSKLKTLESVDIIKSAVDEVIDSYKNLIPRNDVTSFISDGIIKAILEKKFRTKEGTVPKKDIDYVAYLICNYEHLKKDEIDSLIEKYQLSYESIFMRVLGGSSNTRIDLLKRLEIIKGDSSNSMRSVINSLFGRTVHNEWSYSTLPNFMDGDQKYNYLVYTYMNLSDKEKDDVRTFMVYYTNYFLQKHKSRISNILDNISFIIDGNQEINDELVSIILEALYINYDKNIDKVSKILIRDGVDLTNVLKDVNYKEFKKHYIKSLI